MSEERIPRALRDSKRASDSTENVGRCRGRGRFCNSGRSRRPQSLCTSHLPSARTNHQSRRESGRGRGQYCSGARFKSQQAAELRAPLCERSFRKTGRTAAGIENNVNNTNNVNGSISNRVRSGERKQVRHDKMHGKSPQNSTFQEKDRSCSVEDTRQDNATKQVQQGRGRLNPSIERSKSEQQKRKQRILNLCDLKRLLTEEASIIILSLVAPSNGLQARLTEKELEPTMTVQLLKVLAHAFKSKIHPENQHCLVGMLLSSNLFAVHIPSLVAFLPDKKETLDVFENLTDVFLACLRKTPKSAKGIVYCVNFCAQMLNRQKCGNARRNRIKTSMLSIETAIKDILNDNKIVNDHIKSKPLLNSSEVETPDDFRKLPIIPSVEEIHTQTKPFLRKNIIVGKYKNVNHYLDVQFRLLREDFIAPLRSGINQYMLHNASNQKNQFSSHTRLNIYTYSNVVIGGEFWTTDGIMYHLFFDVSKLCRIDWEMSRRLIYGSLVCLSADDFKTVHFATVARRECHEIARGIIGVQFEGKDFGIKINQSEISQVYVMVESPAYFEACRHVLKGLQLLGSSLPLQDQIVYVQKHLKPPNYLTQTVKYEMSCVLDVNNGKIWYSPKTPRCERCVTKSGHYHYFRDLIRNYEISSKQACSLNKIQTECEHGDNASTQDYSSSESEDDEVVPPQKGRDTKVGLDEYSGPYFSTVIDIRSWPSDYELGLDASQKQAMHLALTSSLALIQGPPGTGKTFIGLKIVQLLLHNRNVWDFKKAKLLAPILVVCLTNHALDQFLEGLLHFTKRMVRIGSRSKNQTLANHNIRCLRSRGGRFYNTKEMSNKLKAICKELTEVNLHIQLLSTYILHEDILITNLNGNDKRLLQSLHNGFTEMFGVSSENNPLYPKSILATWLGLTLESFISENEIESFNNFSELNAFEAFSFNKWTKSTPVDLNEPMPGTSEADEDEESIKTEGIGTREQHNRLLDEEDPYIVKPINPDNLREKIWAVEVAKLSDPQYYFPGETLDQTLVEMYFRKAQLRQKIAERELLKMECTSSIGIFPMINLWTLSLSEKWQLYRQWREIFYEILIKKASILRNQYQHEACRIVEARNGEDLEIMRQSDIVGMTTTGAARYHEVLQELGPKIVIVEEAAAVLESHVVTTLTDNTQHLILIGDHKQLRPTTEDYKLSRDYHMDVSLFERMINNDIPYQILQLQHRMRPEISQLLVPLFYDSLEDHESVKGFENINGVTTNVFFVNHSVCEEVTPHSFSHANKFEAEFLVSLCWYFIQQGYKRESITILTTYSGQQSVVSKLMKISLFDGVRVTVVDNYQGEENDIILLSFVRSNDEEIIGFLKTANRVNVALSRARKGLYCIGNFTLFASKCEIWLQLVENLEKNKKIGPSIEIACQKHPATLVQIERGDDFKRFAPEGGCLIKCMEVLKCRHICQRLCHPDPHKCLEPCTRLCVMNHPCPLLCYKECRPCIVLVEKQFPICEHKIFIECHRDINEVVCTTIVERRLNKCGHLAKMECYTDPDTHMCLEKVERLLQCEHVTKLQCYIDPNMYNCVEIVERKLHCGHLLNTKCSVDPKGLPCLVKVDRKLKCGHTVILECHVNPSRYSCQQNVTIKFPDCEHCVNVKCHLRADYSTCFGECNYQLQCGHICPEICHPFEDVEHKEVKCVKKCQRKVCERGHRCPLPCFEACRECSFLVEKDLLCGHKRHVACSQKVEEVFCREICNRKMGCDHLCKEYCGEKCGKCNVLVERPLQNCGHVIRMKCMDDPSCVECTEKCNRRLPCGHYCTYMCNAPCMQHCKHLDPVAGLCGHTVLVYCHAKNNCAVMQTRLCKAECNELLPCGHCCKGTCGGCRQGRVHVPCREKCSRVQICGHACDKLCYQICLPCKRKCPLRCPHSRCPQKCGEKCAMCSEPCKWRCMHERCSKQCGEICKRPRCNQPCHKKLRCNHQCIGLCSEKCPTLCRICNKAELSQNNLFSLEDEKNSRFIQLEYCGHCIDVRVMDQLMDMEEYKIQMKSCPICNTPIWCSRRYKNIIYKKMLDVQRAKEQFLAANESVTTRCLIHTLSEAHSIQKNYPAEERRWQRRLRTYTLQPSKVVVIENQINMLELILNYKDAAKRLHAKAINYLNDDMDLLSQRLLQNEEDITEYELRQINQEISRVIWQAFIMNTVEKCLDLGVEITKNIADANTILAHGRALTDNEENTIWSSLNISSNVDLERVELHSVPNLTAGSWYKCSKDHVYAIDAFDKEKEPNECGKCSGSPREEECSEEEYSEEEYYGGFSRVKSQNRSYGSWASPSRPTRQGKKKAEKIVQTSRFRPHSGIKL